MRQTMRIGFVTLMLLCAATWERAISAQDLDLDCNPLCRQTIRELNAIQANLDAAEGRLRTLYSRLRNAPSAQKAGIVRQIVVLDQQVAALEGRLGGKQRELAQCRQQNRRPDSPSILRSTLVGTATITMFGRGSFPNGPFDSTISMDRPVNVSFSTSRCLVSLFFPRSDFRAMRRGNMLVSSISVVNSAGSSDQGRFHPVSGTAHNIPVSLDFRFVVGDGSTFNVPNVSFMFSSESPLRPDGSLTLVGTSLLTNPDQRVNGKEVLLRIVGTLSPRP